MMISSYAATARGFAKTRKAKRLTHYMWAKESGVSPPTLVALEREDANPTFNTIVHAAEALGFTATIIMVPHGYKAETVMRPLHAVESTTGELD